jgi:5-formyltetrahydrofolate cyclo-ligase
VASRSDDSLNVLLRRKRDLRSLALRTRDHEPNRDELSRQIRERLAGLHKYQAAKQLSIFIGGGSEVETLPILLSAWSQGKRLAVPCCVRDELELYWLECVEELAPRTLGILEPKIEIRRRRGRRADVGSLDLIVAPGVAFDRRGGRLGHGKRFYDELLGKTRPETAVVALAFECQVFPEVPMLAHDVYMDKVVTDATVYRCTSKDRRGDV